MRVDRIVTVAKNPSVANVKALIFGGSLGVSRFPPLTPEELELSDRAFGSRSSLSNCATTPAGAGGIGRTEETCTNCGGDGFAHTPGRVEVNATCELCNGTGRITPADERLDQEGER